MKDEFGDLRTELRGWTVSTPLSRNFKGEVWRKIATSGRASLWGALAEWMGAALLRPIPAGACVALLVALGLGMGAWRGDADASHQRESLMAHYIESVDPYRGGPR
jgi:hypothetical protein